jgi:D-alanine-D-alanine ligase
MQGYNPVCHTPALMEMLGLPYVGHNPLNASTLDNKHAFKRELIGFGIPTVPFMTWSHARGPLRPDINPRFARSFGDFAGPFVVKPVTGRASLHVHVVGLDRLADTAEEVGQLTDNLVLIEPYLPGREFCISVAGPVVAQDGALARRDAPFVFSAIERHLAPDEPIFTSMDIRPITADRWSLVDDPAIVAELTRLARDVHLDFNLETLVRLDVRADAAGRLMVLEANPKPDLKQPDGVATSLVCAGLAAHGMRYDDLILALLAGRIDFLMSNRPGGCGALAELAHA